MTKKEFSRKVEDISVSDIRVVPTTIEGADFFQAITDAAEEAKEHYDGRRAIISFHPLWLSNVISHFDLQFGFNSLLLDMAIYPDEDVSPWEIVVRPKEPSDEEKYFARYLDWKIKKSVRTSPEI